MPYKDSKYDPWTSRGPRCVVSFFVIILLFFGCIDKKDRDCRMDTPPPPDTTDTK